MYRISFTARKLHKLIQNTSTISSTHQPPHRIKYLPACAAAELIITGVEATNLTGAPRPVLVPGPTTKAPV